VPNFTRCVHVATAAGLIVTVVVDAVIIYPVQTATNLLVYETGYFSAAEVRRFGLLMFALTVAVILVITIPYWRLIGLSVTAH
jgi:di/tricarboxylate transporter